MANIGIHITEAINALASLREILSQTTISPQIQDVAKQLEAVTKIFERLQELTSCYDVDDSDFVEDLDALTYCTTLELAAFRDRLLKDHRFHLCTLGRETVASEEDHKVAELEMRNLKCYLRGQSLSMNAILKAWGNKTAKTSDVLTTAQSKQGLPHVTTDLETSIPQASNKVFGDISINDQANVHLGDTFQQVSLHFGSSEGSQHKKIISKLEAQNRTITEVHASLAPMAQESIDTYATVKNIARNTIKQATTLKSLQETISRIPSDVNGDSLIFIDALDRSFKLPFNYFGNWQTFKGFLSHIFHPDQIPGGRHVDSGSYMITTKANCNVFLQESNWNSMVTSGSELTMSIIMNAVKLSLRSCPKSSCGALSSKLYEEGQFVTCKCGLVYRFDPNIQPPRQITDETVVGSKQAKEDLDNFGRRLRPKEVLEVQNDHETASQATSNDVQPLPSRTAQVKNESLITSGRTSDDEDERVNIVLPETEATASQVGGQSGLERWLATSSVPEGEAPPELENDFSAEKHWKRKEEEDLKQLKRVLFMSMETPTKPLAETVPDYTAMPLEEQIYTRKILDNFPSLPPKLASKLARSNIQRKDRLPGLRIVEYP